MPSTQPLNVAGLFRAIVSGAILGAVVGTFLFGVVGIRMFDVDAIAFAIALGFSLVAGAAFGLAVKVFGQLVRPIWLRVLLGFLIFLPALWLSIDLFHSLLIRRSYYLWNAGIVRDSQGVRDGCAAYTVGTGPTALLLVHGFADSPAIYTKMAQALGEVRTAPVFGGHAYTVRVMRLPHWAMPIDDLRQATADEWSSAVGQELASLRKTHKKVVVIAHSMGAAVVLDRLRQEPKSADGVVLLAPLIDVSTARSPLLTPRAWYEILTRLLVFTNQVSMRQPLDLHDQSALKLTRGDRYLPTSIYQHIFTLIERNRGRASEINLPLLMVLASDDPVIDNAAAENYFERWSTATANNAKEIVLDDTGHMMPLDFQWREVVDLIDHFVRDIRDR